MSEDLQMEVQVSPNGLLVPETPPPSRHHRTLTIIGGILCLAIAATIWLRPRHEALLCRNVLNVDAERICEALSGMGVNYTLKDNGSAVYVRSEKVHTARLKVIESLSGSNEPLRFEVVNVGSPALSTNYNVALQSELEATIRAMEGVESARVIIETPGNRGRINGDRPLAVVVIYNASATKLTTEQIDVIQNLVASSTDNLTPAEVTVSEAQNSESLAEFTIESL